MFMLGPAFSYEVRRSDRKICKEKINKKQNRREEVNKNKNR
jgi:hypothetical protein